MIKMQERSFDYPKPNPGVWNMIQISCLDLSLATEATLSHVSEFGFGYWNNRMTGPWIWLGYSNKTNARCQKRGHLRIQDHIQGPEKESLAYPRALFKPLFFKPLDLDWIFPLSRKNNNILLSLPKEKTHFWWSCQKKTARYTPIFSVSRVKHQHKFSYFRDWITLLLHPYYIHRLKHFNRSCSSLTALAIPDCGIFAASWNDLQQESDKNCNILSNILWIWQKSGKNCTIFGKILGIC